ncbi:MAG: LysM domain-containing protein [Anaerolineales bacterium]
MGKRVYRVKKGDDFIKISRKLYGNASYVMDLMRANPGFYRLGKGMVLRLPKEDPRVTRQRKNKRRMKDYVPPVEEQEEQIDWWDDPGFEEEMVNVFAERGWLFRQPLYNMS